jgi:hypothetical protein
MSKKLIKKSALFVIIGLLYVMCEILFRGYSHISMFLLAGICGVFFIDTPNNIYSFELDYTLQILISTILCTLAEGITGLVVNVNMGLNVWDYSSMTFGTFFFGQCNLIFVFAWVILVGLIGIPLCDAYNYYVCKSGEAPYYKIFGKIVLKFKKRDTLGK